jgi:VIT1/CCC1 family predicted Fe2+/Mn2+ transporter
MNIKFAYWITIGLLAIMMLGSAFSYLIENTQMVEAFRHLGYPDYFRVFLGIAKIIGVIVILLPYFPIILKEWAYAGFGITLVSAIVSHLSVGDTFDKVIGPLIALSILIIARFLFGKLNLK